MNKTKRVASKIIATSVLLMALSFVVKPVFASQNIDVSATLKPSASIEISPVGSFAVSPTGNGTFNHSDFSIKAYTNSLNGYTIVMTTDDTNLGRKGVSDEESDGITSIPTLEEKEGGYNCLTYVEEAEFLKTSPDGTVPACTFASNRWGIAVNSGNYFPAFSGMTINRTHEATGSTGDITTVKLGAKIDILAASGTYEATLNFAIVANVTEYPAKINFADENVSSVTFKDGDNERTISKSGDYIDLNIDTEYLVTATFTDGYELGSWTATGGTLTPDSTGSAKFIIAENNYGDITVSSQEATVAEKL